jgi:hypothetical protein
MDKYTQFANKILFEYGTPIEPIEPVASSAEEHTPTEKSADIESKLAEISGGKNRRAYILAGKCIMTGKDAGPFRDELSKREYEISGIGQEMQDKLFDEAEIEDAESAITPEDLKTIETVKSLAGGKAKGGLNPFDNPEKQIQKAYGKILKQVAKKIKNIKI